MLTSHNSPQKLHLNLNRKYSLSRNIRIKKSNLPHDFFHHFRSERSNDKPKKDHELDDLYLDREIKTPSFTCRRKQRKHKTEDHCKHRVAHTPGNYNIDEFELKERGVQQILKLTFSVNKQGQENGNQIGIELIKNDMIENGFQLPKILNKKYLHHHK